jgi:hypothetical protein
MKKYSTVLALDLGIDAGQLAFYYYALTSNAQWVKNVLPFVAGTELLLSLLLMVLYLIYIACLIFFNADHKSTIEGNSKPKGWRHLVSGLNLLAAYCFAAQANYSIAIMIVVTEIISFVAFAIKDGILQSETVK